MDHVSVWMCSLGRLTTWKYVCEYVWSNRMEFRSGSEVWEVTWWGWSRRAEKPFASDLLQYSICAIVAFFFFLTLEVWGMLNYRVKENVLAWRTLVYIRNTGRGCENTGLWAVSDSVNLGWGLAFASFHMTRACRSQFEANVFFFYHLASQPYKILISYFFQLFKLPIMILFL